MENLTVAVHSVQVPHVADGKEERNIPVTLGMAAFLLGGVVTLIGLMMTLGDRFVSQAVFDARMSSMTSDFSRQIGDVRADFRIEIANLRADLLGSPSRAATGETNVGGNR